MGFPLQAESVGIKRNTKKGIPSQVRNRTGHETRRDRNVEHSIVQEQPIEDPGFSAPVYTIML